MSNSRHSSITSAILIVALLGAGLVSVGSESDTRLQQRIDRLDTAVQAAEGVRAIKMPARQGTVGSAAAAPRVLQDMTPDRAIRSRQYAFPEIVEPAFHYKNPVSGRMPEEFLP